MPGSITGKTQPWFTPNQTLSTEVSLDTDINVENISAVFFTNTTGVAIDVELKIGGLATPFPLSAGVPIGIDDATKVIQVNADAFMFAMGGR